MSSKKETNSKGRMKSYRSITRVLLLISTIILVGSVVFRIVYDEQEKAQFNERVKEFIKQDITEDLLLSLSKVTLVKDNTGDVKETIFTNGNQVDLIKDDIVIKYDIKVALYDPLNYAFFIVIENSTRPDQIQYIEARFVPNGNKYGTYVEDIDGNKYSIEYTKEDLDKRYDPIFDLLDIDDDNFINMRLYNERMKNFEWNKDLPKLIPPKTVSSIPIIKGRTDLSYENLTLDNVLDR